MVLLISTNTMASLQRRRELNTSLRTTGVGHLMAILAYACIQTQKSLSSPSSSLLPGILKKIVHPSEMSILSEVHHQPSHLLLWDYHHFQGDGAIILFFIMRITKVFVPRTLVFGLEEAKASPWNVACFRSIQDVFSHCNLWKQTETQFMQIIWWVYIGCGFRIPAVVQTDSGILLAFAEVIIQLYPSTGLHLYIYWLDLLGKGRLMCWLRWAWYCSQAVSKLN